jgi:hypothetical protein
MKPSNLPITNKEKSVRVAGLDLLSKSQLDQELMVNLLDDVIRNRTPEEKQAAITTLGTLPVSHTEKVFVTLLDQCKQVNWQMKFALNWPMLLIPRIHKR